TRLDRGAIFEAMRRRHHYATTGNRAYLDVTVETARDALLFERDPAAGPAPSTATRRLIMGDIARVEDGEVELAVEAIGPAPDEGLTSWTAPDQVATVRP